MIPDTFNDLLEKPVVATLATTMPDGTPQASPVWFNYDGTYIWINTARGRQKDANMSARPHVSLVMIDPDDPYRYLEVRGQVEEVTEQGADEHIDDLSRRYLNRGYWEFRPEQRGRLIRVIYKIRPTHTTTEH